jgi:hypothetical protein
LTSDRAAVRRGIEILVAERDPEHMLDVFRASLVVKAQRKPVHHSDCSIGRAQQQRSCLGSDQPGIKRRFGDRVGTRGAR